MSTESGVFIKWVSKFHREDLALLLRPRMVVNPVAIQFDAPPRTGRQVRMADWNTSGFALRLAREEEVNGKA